MFSAALVFASFLFLPPAPLGNLGKIFQLEHHVLCSLGFCILFVLAPSTGGEVAHFQLVFVGLIMRWSNLTDLLPLHVQTSILALVIAVHDGVPSFENTCCSLHCWCWSLFCCWLAFFLLCLLFDIHCRLCFHHRG